MRTRDKDTLLNFDDISVVKSQLVEYLQTGETNGMIPIFATVKARAMVASGADSALPTMVRFSNEIPKTLRSSTAVRTKVGSLWSTACVVVSTTGSGMACRHVDEPCMCRCLKLRLYF